MDYQVATTELGNAVVAASVVGEAVLHMAPELQAALDLTERGASADLCRGAPVFQKHERRHLVAAELPDGIGLNVCVDRVGAHAVPCPRVQRREHGPHAPARTGGAARGEEKARP